ncbi:MAG: KEOPS complex N(6)-L-threonylcarbamoyladenine synthase Kae1 [Candidatus Bathyarchaeia archaeon]
MDSKKLCLGIESTAHTFGASIVSIDKKILSDVKDVYSPLPGKGIHPREAAQHHCNISYRVILEAFEKAKVKPKDLDVIAFSAGPGLGPALRAGATVARAIATFLKKPLVPVHHAIGHIEIAIMLKKAKDPLVVLVSGGHTAITACVDRRWRIFGETEDITLGNLLDMFAREVDLPFPGGKSVESMASKGKKFIDLPYTVKGNDVSYSGLLTTAIKKFKEGKESLEDICFSIQEVAFAMLSEATERSLAHTQRKELLLTGGVAANNRLKEMLKIIAKEHGAEFFAVDKEYSGDCGAQIAWTGLLASSHNVKIDIEKSYVKPKWRLDEVDIPWRS